MIGEPDGKGAQGKAENEEKRGEAGPTEKGFCLRKDDAEPRQAPENIGGFDSSADGHGRCGECQISIRDCLATSGECEGSEKKDPGDGVVADTARLEDNSVSRGKEPHPVPSRPSGSP